MARIYPTDETLHEIAARMAEQGAINLETDTAVDGSLVPADTSLITCTDTPLAEWIEAQGQPDDVQDGVHYWRSRKGVRRQEIWVVEIEGGTAAHVS